MEHPRSRAMAGRTVLVTGATTGIGRATAVGLATMGAHVAITGRDCGRRIDFDDLQGERSGAEDPGRVQRLVVPFLRPFMKSPARGAVTSIHVSSAPDVELVSGRYFAGSRPRRSSARSHDEDVAARLWAVSADLVGLTAAARG